MSLSRHGLLYAAAILSCAAAAPDARAQPFEVTVPIGQSGTLTSPSARQATQQLRQIPGGAAVVPAEQFQDGYALSMKDMLSGTPGVLAQPRWGEESRLSIRGSGLSRGFHLRGIILRQDGVPFNFADGSGDFQEIDPLVLQHVEVYRGGNALRYGAASLGGAVNLVTPTAKTAGHTVLLRTEGGSFKTLRNHAQAAQDFGGFDIFTAVTKANSNGFREQSEQNNARFTGNTGIALGDNAETRFYLNWNDIEQDIPGTVSKRNALNDPEAVPAVNVLNDYSRDIRSVRVANKTALRMDSGALLELGGYLNDKSLYHPIFQVIDQDSKDAGLFTRLAGPWTAAGMGSQYVMGLNLGHGNNDAKRFVNVRGNRGALTAEAEQTARNAEFYAENSLEFIPRWHLVTGFQAAWSDRDYSDRLNSANDDRTAFRSFNPKIGLLYNVTPDSEIYVSITRSSEVPTFSELVQGAVPGFVPVKLQKAWTAEVGTRGGHGNITWDATLYHARVKDEMLQFSIGPDIPASTFNADDTIHQGLELGLGWQATRNITLHGVYNYSDFTFDDDAQFGDNDLAGAAPHEIRLSVRYQSHGAYIEPNIEWVPQAAYVDYANTLKSDEYTTLGIKAGWDVNDNVTLFLDARNLTDEKFIPSFSTLTDARTAANRDVFYPGDGRAVFGGLKVMF